MRYWNASFRAPRASFDVLLKDKEGKETSSFIAIHGSLPDPLNIQNLRRELCLLRGGNMG